MMEQMAGAIVALSILRPGLYAHENRLGKVVTPTRRFFTRLFNVEFSAALQGWCLMAIQGVGKLHGAPTPRCSKHYRDARQS